jgi:hypothetical protein
VAQSPVVAAVGISPGAWAHALLSAPLVSAKALVTAVHQAMRFVADHTGIPMVVVAAVLLVLSVRMARKSGRILLEVAVVLVILVAATKLGLIAW